MKDKPTVIAKLLNKILKDQAEYLAMVPEEKRRQGYGRAASVVIEGQNGGTFDLWFTESGVATKPPGVPIKNHAWMVENTFWDCVTPDLRRLERRDEKGKVVKTGMEVLAEGLEKNGVDYILKEVVPNLSPRMDFRYALSKQLITVDGDTSIYDSEEWAQAIEKLIIGKIFPVIVRTLAEKGSFQAQKGRQAGG